MKRININIPYRECPECKKHGRVKPIRYYNTTGICSNCQNEIIKEKHLKGKFKRK